MVRAIADPYASRSHGASERRSLSVRRRIGDRPTLLGVAIAYLDGEKEVAASVAHDDVEALSVADRRAVVQALGRAGYLRIGRRAGTEWKPTARFERLRKIGMVDCDGRITPQGAAFFGFRLERCTGEAHSNAYVDHCGICAPLWGKVWRSDGGCTEHADCRGDRGLAVACAASRGRRE